MSLVKSGCKSDRSLRQDNSCLLVLIQSQHVCNIQFNKKLRFGGIFIEAPNPSCYTNKEMNFTQMDTSGNTDPPEVETDIEFVSRTQKVMDYFS